VARLIAQLQAAPAMAQAIAAQRALAEAAAEVKETLLRDEVRAAEPAVGLIEVGARVRHLGFGSEGLLLELSGENAVVQLGALRTKVPVKDLIPLGKAGPKGAAAGFRKSKKERLDRAESARAAPIEVRLPTVDVRGQRVDEALRSLDAELDRHLRAGEESVVVLHGHGTGALKSALREELQRSPYVARVRSGESHEGGDGVTVVTLR